MAKPLSFLVIGVDGLVGAALARDCAEAGHRVSGTTRRVPGPDRLFLDLATTPRLTLDRPVDVAYLVAAQASYAGCETDPACERVNVHGIPSVGAQLLEAGAFVVFLSSNTVFGGERPACVEDAPLAPRIAYARQKAIGEAALRDAAARLGASNRLCIVRLTKILAPATAPLPQWFEHLGAGRPIEPFADLIFAPMSLPYVVRGLRAAGEARLPGPFHLSGAEDVSYVQFAEALVDAIGAPRALVRPTTAIERGLTIAFKPRHSALGMERTRRALGLEAEPIEHVALALASAAR